VPGAPGGRGGASGAVPGAAARSVVDELLGLAPAARTDPVDDLLAGRSAGGAGASSTRSAAEDILRSRSVDSLLGLKKPAEATAARLEPASPPAPSAPPAPPAPAPGPAPAVASDRVAASPPVSATAASRAAAPPPGASDAPEGGGGASGAVPEGRGGASGAESATPAGGPDDVVAVAISDYQAGHHERAITRLQELRRAGRPDSTRVATYLAASFLEMGHPEIAITEVDRLAAAPVVDDDLYLLATRFEAHHLTARALDLYRRLYAQNVSYRDVRERLSVLSRPSGPAAADEAILSRIPARYKDATIVGRGGMGVVLRALDTDLDRVVAIKLLSPHLQGSEDIEQRFFLEARTLARLKHPGILEIYDINKSGLPFIAMEFLDGKNLADLLRGRALTLGKALRAMLDVVGVLGYCHANGVVHRDVKPENVFITTAGATKLVDFGLVRTVDTTGLTRPGFAMGSPPYMSPEQLRGGEVDSRSDIYSVGVCLYFLCTGRLPFRDEVEHFAAPAKPPRQLNPQLPAALESLILKCLHKDPQARHATCEELSRELSPFCRKG
jgi:hypothetical protein